MRAGYHESRILEVFQVDSGPVDMNRFIGSIKKTVNVPCYAFYVIVILSPVLWNLGPPRGRRTAIVPDFPKP